MPATAGWEASASLESSSVQGDLTHMKVTRYEASLRWLSMQFVKAKHVTTR